MPNKRRISLRVHDDEIAVVGKREAFEYIAELLEWATDEAPEYTPVLKEYSEWLRNWLSRAAPSRPSDYEDWE